MQRFVNTVLSSGTSLISDMGGHYPEHQKRVDVGTILTSNMLLHAKKTGFITLCHNRLRNITASLLKEVCHDVRIEPTLQKLTSEQFEQRAANTSDEARLDVPPKGFWEAGQIALFFFFFFFLT